MRELNSNEIMEVSGGYGENINFELLAENFDFSQIASSIGANGASGIFIGTDSLLSSGAGFSNPMDFGPFNSGMGGPGGVPNYVDS